MNCRKQLNSRVLDPCVIEANGHLHTADADNPGGAALHADWFNGWHPSVMEAILETCIQDRLDCHDGNLANGFRLSDVFEGVQNDPEVINDGLGNMDHHGAHEDPSSDGHTDMVETIGGAAVATEQAHRMDGP